MQARVSFVLSFARFARLSKSQADLACDMEVSMRHFAYILIALAFPSAATAVSWTFVANCGEQGQTRAYSYDRDSVRRDHGGVQVRIKGDYSRVAGSRSQEAMIHWSFDCKSRTFVERSRAEYGPNRTMVANYDTPTSRMAATPASIAGKVLALVCG